MAACIVQRARARSGRAVPARKHYFGCVPRYRAYEACARTRPKPMAEALQGATPVWEASFLRLRGLVPLCGLV